MQTETTKSTKQTSSKQFIVAVFILALATKMFLLPISLIRATGRDGYIALAIGAGLDLVLLGLTLAAMKLSPDTDFFTLLEETLGRVGARIAAGFITVFLFFKLSLAATETVSFYSDSVFGSFNVPLMMIILLVFLFAVANHTLRALCRLNEFTVPLIVIGIAVLAAIVIATGFDLGNILPAMQKPKTFMSAAMRHTSWIGDFSPLALFIGRTEQKRHTLKIAAASGVVGTAVTVFFAIVMCAAFGNVPMLADSSTNISNIVQFSLGNVYGRIDLFSAVLWSVAAFIETALFFYAAARCASYTIGRDANFAVGLCMCALLYFFEVFAMTDPVIFTAIVSSAAASAATAFFSLFIPLIALIGGAKRRRGMPVSPKKRGAV